MTEQVQHRTRSSARLRFVLDGHSADIAVPAEVPLADLLPALLPHFGGDVIEQGAEHEGWVLQRLGDPPLDEERTVAELGLRDGDVVHVRPRADGLAPIDYDDIVDGVGEQVRNHPWAWTEARTRAMLRVGAAVALLAGVPLVVAAGAGPVPPLMAFTVALVALGAAALVARGGAGPVVATGLAGIAVAHAATGGALLARVVAPAASGSTVLACAAAVGLMVLAAGMALVADGALLFVGAAVFGVMLAVAGLVGAVSAFTLPQAAAVAVAVSLIAGVFVPGTAFRLSGLTLPLLPGEPDQLADDVEPVPHALVVERGTAVVGYSGALHVGLGAAQLVLLPTAAAGGGTWPVVFVLVVAALLLLRSRHPDGTVARWAIVAPAAAAVVASLLVASPGMDAGTRILTLWLPVLALGALLAVLAEQLPGRRLRPYWGRAVDILESLTAVAALPVLLQVLGVYATMRGLGG